MASSVPSKGLAPRIILTVVSIFTVVGSFAADFNETHVYNPLWPGHAKFHNGQTMSFSIFMALVTLWHTWLPTVQDRLLTASVLASGYFVTQLTAMLFPGATAWDPPQHFSLVFPQAFMIVPVLGVIGLAFWLERQRLVTAEKAKTK